MTQSTPEIGVRLGDISLIARDLLKVIKVVSMYPENNPLPQSMKRSFAERLEALVAEFGSITLTVERDRVLWHHEVVYEDRSREENLAGMFFDAGITEFTFHEGLNQEEIFALLEVIGNYVNTPDKSTDLAAMLWEAAIMRFTVITLEDVVLAQYSDDFLIQENGNDVDPSSLPHPLESIDAEDYNAIFEPEETGKKIEFGSLESDTNPNAATNDTGRNRTVFYSVIPGKTSDSTVVAEENQDSDPLKTNEAASAMGFDDIDPEARPIPNTTLILNDEFKLTSEEQQEISILLSTDSSFDSYESTSELLKEMLHQESELRGFGETVTICERIIGAFVQQARLVEASELLMYMQRLEEQIESSQKQWAERLKEARIALGSRDSFKTLANSLNANPEISSAELRRYLECFGWEALGSITDLIGDIYNEFHRKCIVDYLTVRGSRNIDIIGKGVFDRRPDVVRNAVTLLGRIGDSRALQYLGRAIDHPDDSVRLELVKSLIDNPNDQVLSLLRTAVSDTNPEVRSQAVASIVARRGRAAFDTISEIVEDPNFVELGAEDKQSLLVAYSILGGEAAVGYLADLASMYNLWRNNSLGALRDAAFEALAHNQSEKCERSLLKLARSLRPNIKRQAVAALHRRRELMYGGE